MENIENTAESLPNEVEGLDAEGTETPVENADVAAKQAAEQKKEEKKYVNRIKLKVDKQEYDEELPFEVEDNPEVLEYLTKNLQKARASDKRFEESTQLRKTVGNFLNTLQTDTKRALIEAGIDPRQFVAQMIEEELKQQEMSPEEREKNELQTRLKNLEEEREREKREYEKKELERLQDMEYEKVERDIVDALQVGNLPKTSYTVEKMARYMTAALKHNIELTAKDLVPVIKDDFERDLKQMVGVMPDEFIEQFLGRERFNSISKKKAVKAAPVTPATAKAGIVDTANKNSAKKEAPKTSFKDLFGYGV